MPRPLIKPQSEVKRHKGKHVLMLGSTWHEDASVCDTIKYETRIDAFVLGTLEALREKDFRKIPYQEMFDRWRQAHLVLLTNYYGVALERAEEKTDSWLRTLMDVGQGIRELLTDFIDYGYPEEYIVRVGTKTCFMIGKDEIIKIHKKIYGGGRYLRPETTYVFLHDPDWGHLYLAE